MAALNVLFSAHWPKHIDSLHLKVFNSYTRVIFVAFVLLRRYEFLF